MKQSEKDSLSAAEIFHFRESIVYLYNYIYIVISPINHSARYIVSGTRLVGFSACSNMPETPRIEMPDISSATNSRFRWRTALSLLLGIHLSCRK